MQRIEIIISKSEWFEVLGDTQSDNWRVSVIGWLQKQMWSGSSSRLILWLNSPYRMTKKANAGILSVDFVFD